MVAIAMAAATLALTTLGLDCWRDVPGPGSGNWLPEAISNIELRVGGHSLGQALEICFRKPFSMWICVSAALLGPSPESWESAYIYRCASAGLLWPRGYFQ